jgi:hypothetical protein
MLVVSQYSLPSNPVAVKSSAKTLLLNSAFASLAIFATFFTVNRLKHFRAIGETGAKVWFYDQSAKRLYAAPRDLVPPDGNDDTRVRATVIGFEGMGNNVSQLKIAYLEKYSPELKATLERARKAHAALKPFSEKIPSQGSPYYKANTFVKQKNETSWHELGSAEAATILAAWHDWHGPGGQRPVISVPSIQ